MSSAASWLVPFRQYRSAMLLASLMPSAFSWTFSISSEVDYIMSNPGHRIDVGAFGKEFYTYDSVKKELAIYSLDGELKKTIPAFRDFSLFYMGDDNYIFANDGNFCRMAINDPSTGWQEIKKGDR